MPSGKAGSKDVAPAHAEQTDPKAVRNIQVVIFEADPTLKESALHVRAEGLKRRMQVVTGPTLTRASILATIDAHADELRHLGAKSLALFGSMARGEGSASSDIDLLVELEPKTFDSYMDVKLFLEKLLGRKVDLVLADALKPRLRPLILAEAGHAARL